LDRFISFTIPNQEKSGVANQFFDLKNQACVTAAINYTFLNKKMPLYHKLGTFPKKDTHNSKNQMEVLLRTIVWNRRISWSCFFISMCHRPTQVKEILKSYSVEPKIAIGKKHQIVVAKGLN
jgi:hypothetical protein